MLHTLRSVVVLGLQHRNGGLKVGPASDTVLEVGDRVIVMGQEADLEQRRKAFQGYTVTPELLERAAPGAIFLHCLPAHRGEEVEESVLEGPRSRVWDEAENRLHVQKALLLNLVNGQR